MMFALLERYSRSIVQYVVRKTFKGLLSDWVTDVNGFLLMLETTGGGVTGSVARMLMEINSTQFRESVASQPHRNIQCNDLNLVVPDGQFSDALAFIRGQGYAKVDESTPDHPYVETVSRFATCLRVGTDLKVVSRFFHTFLV